AVNCGLCRFRCRILPGRRGRCGVRENREGLLYSLVYGVSVATNVDPIEKKPLYHLLPGSSSFSIATIGCNFRCLHCQNYQISQWPSGHSSIPGDELPPQEVVSRALSSGCRSIAYTYTEPTIFFEYAYDTAVLAHQAGLKNVFVTNGYTSPEALAAIAPYLDAANVDLKGFNDDVYREVTGARLEGVLETLRDYRHHRIWLEVTTLIIPGYNDDSDELRELATFIRDELGPEVPWHVSGYYPAYRMDAPATPVKTLQMAEQIGLEVGLQQVYLGNRPGSGGEVTLCPECRAALVERVGFRVVRQHLIEGQCPECHHPLPGVWI
ncbi:MAG: AmmeMemoRadiSam system radical SAM enzyme, partial [Desulfuromonas sp.]